MQHRLSLYIAGEADNSVRALQTIRRICLEHLNGDVELHVIDIDAEPEAASAHGIRAAPTLVRERPTPVQMLVGDLSDERRILDMLELPHPDEQQECRGHV
ncbi:MAG: circadian clock KaiB family protein [Phycisphaerae bacterium]|jgi:circadian clock protein KaiB